MRRSRLLIVNESKVERMALLRQLEHASFRVDAAANLDEAEAFLQSVRYQAVLVNLDDVPSISPLLRLRVALNVRVYALCKASRVFCAGGCDALDGVFHHPLKPDALLNAMASDDAPRSVDAACDKVVHTAPKLRVLSA